LAAPRDALLRVDDRGGEPACVDGVDAQQVERDALGRLGADARESTQLASCALIVAALLLAAVGLYSVTAYATEQRTREIGLRIALGAQARQIWWLVTRSATRQLVVGLSVGIAGAIGLGQLLRGLLIGTSATDPVTLAAVTALLALVTFVASVIPARRAIRIDPIATLRSE